MDVQVPAIMTQIASFAPNGQPQFINRLALAVAILVPMAGCTTFQLPSMLSRDDVTGSIAKPVSPISAALDAEDSRRAQAALSVALDPQGNGFAVSWDNPQSGVEGSFSPTEKPYVVGDRLCRAFVSELGGTVPVQKSQGVACREKGRGEWAITDLRPLKSG